mmetsp:Transcript_12159/g.16581  ORF Transcript_12159/g.16581 Transcript_12159/m.16581 type:complete len:87 (+) Transcript_12159:432-692(+)
MSLKSTLVHTAPPSAVFLAEGRRAQGQLEAAPPPSRSSTPLATTVTNAEPGTTLAGLVAALEVAAFTSAVCDTEIRRILGRCPATH